VGPRGIVDQDVLKGIEGFLAIFRETVLAFGAKMV
jgi:hypothetical protein